MIILWIANNSMFYIFHEKIRTMLQVTAGSYQLWEYTTYKQQGGGGSYYLEECANCEQQWGFISLESTQIAISSGILSVRRIRKLQTAAGAIS